LSCSAAHQDPDAVGLQGTVRHLCRTLTFAIRTDRYAKYYKEDGTDKRTLYKVFGIRFDILVNGKVRVARHWVCPRMPRMAVPCPQECTSSGTQRQGFLGPGKPVQVASPGAGLLTAALGNCWGKEHRGQAHFTGHVCQLRFGQWLCCKKHHEGGNCGKSKPFTDISKS